jgi:hypothetical protein
LGAGVTVEDCALTMDAAARRERTEVRILMVVVEFWVEKEVEKMSVETVRPM